MVSSEHRFAIQLNSRATNPHKLNCKIMNCININNCFQPWYIQGKITLLKIQERLFDWKLSGPRTDGEKYDNNLEFQVLSLEPVSFISFSCFTMTLKWSLKL